MKSDPSSQGALAPDVPKREVFAWAMYDFANSGYTTVVITAVFNAYFVARRSPGNAPWATFALDADPGGLVRGGRGDRTGHRGVGRPARGEEAPALDRRRSAASRAPRRLALAGPGTLVLACVLVAVSNFFFGTGENLTAAFLPELARGEALGTVSGWGWSLGYLGGMLTLGLCLDLHHRRAARGCRRGRIRPGRRC